MTTEDMMWADYDYFMNTDEPEDWFEDENENECEDSGEPCDDDNFSIEEYISQLQDETLNKERYRKNNK